jgi:hypothetical protein
MTGVSQPSPLAAAQHHAQALAATGDLPGAQLTLLYALEGGRAELGEDDPAVLATAHQLATVHRQAGDPSAARRVLEEAFAAGHWRLGDADPLMLSISFDLGVVAEELGNRHEARRAFGRVAGVGPGVLGDDHWAVLQAREYLGHEPPTVRLELPDTPPLLSPATGVEPPPEMYPTSVPPDLGPRMPAQRIKPTSGPPPAQGSPPVEGPRPAQVPPQTPWSPVFEEQEGQPASQGPAAVAGPAPVEARPVDTGLVDAGLVDTGLVDAGAAETAAAPGLPAVQRPTALERPGMGSPASGVPARREPAMPVYFPERGPEPRGRVAAIVAAVVAAAAALVAVAALIVVLVSRDDGDNGGDGPDRGGRPEAPVLGGGRPPSDVRLRDIGSTVELSWTDPTVGTVPFIVTGGHPGEVLKPLGQIGPGQTTLKLNGLNSSLDYCFAVVAVYSTSEFNTSPQTCTNRARSTPKQSRTT